MVQHAHRDQDALHPKGRNNRGGRRRRCQASSGGTVHLEGPNVAAGSGITCDDQLVPEGPADELFMPRRNSVDRHPSTTHSGSTRPAVVSERFHVASTLATTALSEPRHGRWCAFHREWSERSFRACAMIDNQRSGGAEPSDKTCSEPTRLSPIEPPVSLLDPVVFGDAYGADTDMRQRSDASTPFHRQTHPRNRYAAGDVHRGSTGNTQPRRRGRHAKRSDDNTHVLQFAHGGASRLRLSRRRRRR